MKNQIKDILKNVIADDRLESITNRIVAEAAKTIKGVRGRFESTISEKDKEIAALKEKLHDLKVELRERPEIEVVVESNSEDKVDKKDEAPKKKRTPRKAFIASPNGAAGDKTKVYKATPAKPGTIQEVQNKQGAYIANPHEKKD